MPSGQRVWLEWTFMKPLVTAVAVACLTTPPGYKKKKNTYFWKEKNEKAEEQQK